MSNSVLLLFLVVFILFLLFYIIVLQRKCIINTIIIVLNQYSSLMDTYGNITVVELSLRYSILIEILCILQLIKNRCKAAHLVSSSLMYHHSKVMTWK